MTKGVVLLPASLTVLLLLLLQIRKLFNLTMDDDARKYMNTHLLLLLLLCQQIRKLFNLTKDDDALPFYSPSLLLLLLLLLLLC